MKILYAKIAVLTLTLLLLCSGLAAREGDSTPPLAPDNQATSPSSESSDAGTAGSNVRIVRLSETTGEGGDTRGSRHIPGDGLLIITEAGSIARTMAGDGGRTASGGASQTRPAGC